MPPGSGGVLVPTLVPALDNSEDREGKKKTDSIT